MVKPSSIILLIALTISLLGNVYFLNKNREANKQISEIESNKQVFLQQYQVLLRDNERLKNSIKSVSNPNLERFILQGKEPGRDAVIFWDPETKVCTVDANRLPSPPPNLQYQSWYKKNGQYFDLGVFNHQPDKDNTFELKKLPAKTSLLISLELPPRGQQPNLEQIVASFDKMIK